MEEETRYFYQPNLTTTIISWCWTFLILIAGLVVWLEITHFQWVTALLFLLFIIVTLLGIFRRTVLITPSKMVFSRVLQKDTVSLTVNGEVFNFAFSNKAIRRLKLALNNLKGEQQG